MTTHTAVLFDWGGVLTQLSMPEAIMRWCVRDSIDLAVYREVLHEWTALPMNEFSPIRELECGRISAAEGSEYFARALRERGQTVQGSGLLDRMLLDLVPLEPLMLSEMRRLQALGVRVALLSNSWGDHYPDELYDGYFDTMVISGEVGMCKPDGEIFRHTCERLGVSAQECVMVDDLERNISAAEALGMTGLLHVGPEETIRRLQVLFPNP